MGRKKKTWPAVMKALWVPELNGRSCVGVMLSSEEQYYWRASCGQLRHYRYMQPRSVLRALERNGSNGSGSNGSGSSGLRCPICEALQTELSRHVPPVQAATTSTGQLWLAEVHCLQGRFSPADIWLPAFQLAVQIDGAGHQFVQVFSKTLEQQQHTDWRFDNETVRQGKRALRLHYRDAEDSQAAGRVLAAALQLCRQHPSIAFVMYSTSYNRPVKWHVDAEYLEEVGSSGSSGST
jgi:hypothetical protein